MTKLSDLKPDKANANKGTERGRQALEASLRSYGAGRSILVDKNGVIVAGNKTAKMAEEIGIDDVIVIQTDGTKLVAVQRTDIDIDTEAGRMLAYADNRVGQLDLAFDAEQVLADLNAGVDLTAMWDKEELDELLGNLVPKDDTETGADAEPQINRAEELNRVWQVKPGDLWKIGEHRLVCGDCTDPAIVAKVMQGEKAQILFTSPPYWVGFEYEQQDKWSEILAFIDKFTALYVSHVKDDGRIIINTGTVQAGQLTGQRAHMRLLIDLWANGFESNGWLMRYVRFWVKDGGLLHTAPQSDCIDQHTEFLGYFYNPESKFRGQERTGTPWAGKGYWDDIPGTARQSGHIAAFPVEIPSRNILLFAREGETTFDPFAGSGTTGIACENLGRVARLIELSPDYCAVILQRFVDAFGLTGIKVE